MEDIKNKVEAVLFSSGKKMTVEEVSKICRTSPETVAEQLKQLKNDYDNKDSSLLLMDEGDGWKLTVREQYTNVVRKIVAETELTRTMMETLAVIAWKAPVLQSDIIKVRTNKAYDHLSELESTGFISREKHGRTKLLKLTERFFNYFDLKNADEVKEKFKIEEPKPEEQKPSEDKPSTEETTSNEEINSDKNL
ncbi:SMC-Scp complex subunit ScpB [Candidatus Woesearchaeota archaeon]|nr:SMC-Scp complex subunit ScpB [Candidatus Woesearchaeota archaeon]|tara:strand:- start:1000 stop:1581 length:582 start_codon:yes stop_codon:yes gene_type:complete